MSDPCSAHAWGLAQFQRNSIHIRIVTIMTAIYGYRCELRLSYSIPHLQWGSWRGKKKRKNSFQQLKTPGVETKKKNIRNCNFVSNCPGPAKNRRVGLERYRIQYKTHLLDINTSRGILGRQYAAVRLSTTRNGSESSERN